MSEFERSVELLVRPLTCSRCGKVFEGAWGATLVDDKYLCSQCEPRLPHNFTAPVFFKYIPGMCTGVDMKIFTFTTHEDFQQKILPFLDNHSVLVMSAKKRDHSIEIGMQSLLEKSYLCLGTVENYNFVNTNYPRKNYDIYNKDNSVNMRKVEAWLGGKTVVIKW